MRVFLAFIGMCFVLPLFGQNTGINPIQEATASKHLCQPGVLNKSRSRGIDIAYNYNSGGNLHQPGDQFRLPISQVNSIESFILKVRVPVVLRPNLKVLLGYYYTPETYRFGEIAPFSTFQEAFTSLDNQRLKSNAFSVYVTGSLTEKMYTVARFRLLYNGDYRQWINFDQRYALYNAAAMLGIKENEHFEWGVGLVYTRNFHRQLLLPFVMINKNFNEKWGIEAVPPVYMFGRYNINTKNILLFGTEFNNQHYAIDIPNRTTSMASPYYVTHSEIMGVVSLERQLVPWVWLNIKGGYQHNLDTRFRAASPDASTFQISPASGLFFRLGIFVSPPDSMK